mgnify:CR=1 FL=1
MSTKHNPQDIKPEHIAQLLTRSARQLDDNTLAALRRARSVALERQSLSKPIFALNTGHGIHGLVPHSAYQWVATGILLVIMLFGGASYWQHMQQQEHDMSHVDVAILTDDLPLEVFVD